MLRILIVECGDEAEGSDCFGREGTTSIVTASLAEAEEALSLQRFDAILIRGPQAPDGFAGFVARLRDRERHGDARTPLLRTVAAMGEQYPGVDAVLLEDFDLAALRETLNRLNQPTYGGGESNSPGTPALAPFDGEAFAEHLGHDAALIVEIIDLFFAECGQQLPDLAERLAIGDFERVSRIAHTLKGSLSSLQAPGPRLLAQQLEEAAKRRDGTACSASLKTLEDSIAAIRPKLLALRDRSERLL